jgi:predicted Zn-dependent protease
VALWLCAGLGIAQVPDTGVPASLAYPEPESAAAWRSLAASYVRKAVRDQKLDKDPVLNARIDAVMGAVGAAVATIEPRYAGVSDSWKAILIQGFGRGAAAFPGETILVDATFVRNLSLSDDELALILSHEAAHVVARHASAKLSFMAEILGKEKVPTASTALIEFMTKDSYATEFQPKARQHEREADTLGAAIFFSTGYDPQRALTLFDKLAAREPRSFARVGQPGQAADTHDSAATRRQIVAAVIAKMQERQSQKEQH